MLKLNIKPLSIKKGNAKSLTKNHIPNHIQSVMARIEPSVYRAGRKMIYRRSRDTFTDIAIQTETDDVSQD